LRVASPWVNPMTWIIAGLAIWAVRGKVSLGLWGLTAGLIAAGFVLSSVPLPRGFDGFNSVLRRIPNFPGPLNQLIRKNLRAMLTTLDLYCGLLLSVLTLGVRLSSVALPPEALMVMTILIVIALSSYAQCLFGLDGKGGLARYRLLPLSGWQVLAAKDIAFLLVAMLLTLPAAPFGGLGGALIALAIGHDHSVNEPRPQVRWRFSTGAPFVWEGLGQVAAIAVAASSIILYSRWLIIPCIAACIGSAWWYGRELEKLS
jgi:hypothetical protein